MSVRGQSGPDAPLMSLLEAVLFDMDGVVTDTAQAHAAAWQRLFDEYLKARAERRGEEFRPFDPRHDYRQYVDGKLRMDGVRSFLQSRGIELPWGHEDDGPDAETVCGLGRRKDRYFHAWLEENRVHAYPGSVNLIAALREAGIRTAVFSSSRNAEVILRSAKVLGLFDVRVDGHDLAELNIPGKPDPAMLLEAARRSGVEPAHSAVFEDAIAGVEAASKGEFGLVVGVDRANGGDALKKAGADLIVQDLSEMRFVPGTGLTVKTLATLPGVWDRRDEIRRRLSRGTPAVFLDYDGTLTPIVENHDKALLSDAMRATVEGLARCCTVVIVSGRDLGKLRDLVDLDSVWYAGSHGFEIVGPKGSDEGLEMGTEFLSELDDTERALANRLADIRGHALERKRFSIAVHYRRVSEDDFERLEDVVDGILGEHPRLYRGHGKKVFELRPDIEWNKGRAVSWILERISQRFSDAVVPIYVGDDITDEDAFHTLTGHGLCIAVRHEEMRQSAADYTLSDTRDVKRFLQWLTEITANPDATEGSGP
jgi:trehalose-phosphatase